MEIVVHYPEDRQGISALRKAVAETHSGIHIFLYRKTSVFTGTKEDDYKKH